MKLNLKKNLVLVLVVIILLSAIFVVYSFKFDRVVDTKEIEMTLIVENSRVIGFDVNDEVLSFGKVPKGASNIRLLTIENNYDFPVRVRLIKEGDISEFVRFSDNNFLLSPSDLREINVVATPSQGAIDKIYGGTLKIFFLK